MPGKDEIPLGYRRYISNVGIPLQSQPAPPAVDETARKEAKAVIPPGQKLRLLESKVNDNIDNPKLLNEFIKLGYELEEYELIEGPIKRYLGRHSRDNGIRQSYAMVLLRMGNRRRAKIELRRILTNNPRFKPAREALERMRKNEL